MARAATDDTLSEKIVQLRNEGVKWAEITDATGIPPGKAMLMYDKATITPKERIKNPTPALIQKARDGGMSWGKIMAATDLPETKVRSMYTEATGTETLGHRIGKGGRFPGNGADVDGKKVKPAAGKTKKTVAPSAAVIQLNELVQADDLEGVQNMLTGRAVKLGTDGEVVKIRAVKAVKNGAVQIVNDETGKARVLKVANIVGVSKAKVVKAKE
jgi:hypothetical protein